MTGEYKIGEDYIFTFGSYKKWKLSDCPKEYLINFFYANKNRKDNINEVQSIVDFIKEKYKYELYPSLKNKLTTKITPKQEEGYEKTIIPQPKISGNFNFVQILCKKNRKIIFANKSDAKFELKRIQKSPQKNEHKPNRAYECPHCGGWHLTSKEYDKKTNRYI